MIYGEGNFRVDDNNKVSQKAVELNKLAHVKNSTIRVVEPMQKQIACRLK